MKRSHVWFAVAGVAAAAIAISLVALPSRTEWTTSSPAALEEFERANAALFKQYTDDAVAHLERAVEHDTDFVIAKLLLAGELTKAAQTERANALFDEVVAADLSGLTPRERFIIERTLMLSSGQFSNAAHFTESFYAEHPDDPYIIEIVANEARDRGDVEKAEKLYLRLLEVAPNWVRAYNRLGYMAMTLGRFPEAEEYFTSFRFIAPDQANPHDSLAELYIIQGRYEEAESSLETALEIKPDFWPAYRHLVLARILMRDFGATRKDLDRWAAQEGASDVQLAHARRAVTAAELDDDSSWGELIGLTESVYLEASYPGDSVSRAVHRAACKLGSWDVATGLENRLEKYLERAQREGAGSALKGAWPALLQMKGVRWALQHDYDTAEERFMKADAQLDYREAAPGIFKLETRLLVVETLLAQGRQAEAHELLDRIRRVNRTMVLEFEADGLTILGLERG